MNRPVFFGSTLWTLVDRARAGDRSACEQIFHQYRPPIVNFAAARGFADNDAEDIAQEVLMRLIKVLANADQSKGRFRSLILGITRNVMKQEWSRRHRESPKVNLDAGDPEEDGRQPEIPAKEIHDESFDALWVDNLVCMAMDDLRKQCEQKNSPHYQALFAYANEDASYQDIARRLGKDIQDVKSYIYLARQHIKRFVRNAIAEYSSGDEYEAEAAYFMKFLG